MNWKSTALAGTAGLAVTWFASYAPVGQPAVSRTPPATVARTERAAADIQHEASRLHERMQQVAAFREPSRNPFRFAERTPRVAPRAPTITVEDLPPAQPVRPTFRMLLAGIAEDTVGDEIVRTAIISTPDEVFLVKAGEQVGDRYKVVAIAEDAVELVRLDDSTSVQLRLGVRY